MKNRKGKPSSSGARRAGGGRAGRGRRRGAPASNANAEQRRLVIAQQAARLVIDQGIADYGFAKRKAAERLGGAPESLLPSNREVEQALLDHQRLFGGREVQEHLAQMREGALQAMRFFARFESRAVGPLLNGAVSEHTPVTLHLYTDTPEDVARTLLDAGIRHRSSDQRLRFSNNRSMLCPAFLFVVEGIDYVVLVLPADAIREAPLSPVDGRPERRMTAAELAALRAGSADAGDALGDDG